MAITLDLQPEVEQELLHRAQERGLSLHEYLERLVRDAASVPSVGIIPGDQKASAFLQWADSFPDTPLLSDDAISRTSLYPDRW